MHIVGLIIPNGNWWLAVSLSLDPLLSGRAELYDTLCIYALHLENRVPTNVSVLLWALKVESKTRQSKVRCVICISSDVGTIFNETIAFHSRKVFLIPHVRYIKLILCVPIVLWRRSKLFSWNSKCISFKIFRSSWSQVRFKTWKARCSKSSLPFKFVFSDTSLEKWWTFSWNARFFSTEVGILQFKMTGTLYCKFYFIVKSSFPARFHSKKLEQKVGAVFGAQRVWTFNPTSFRVPDSIHFVVVIVVLSMMPTVIVGRALQIDLTHRSVARSLK